MRLPLSLPTIPPAPFVRHRAINALGDLLASPKPDLDSYTGGLSRPSKMPCASYGLPARACGVGSKLYPIKGSICSDCYALKGFYTFGNVQETQYRRLSLVTRSMNSWAAAMVLSIRAEGNDVFRWHDSGDLQSISHLRAIVWIAEMLPEVRFWLPTKETGILAGYLAIQTSEMGDTPPIPANLLVRVSTPLMDQDPANLHKRFAHTSGVHDVRPAFGVQCMAPSQGGHCLDCRACWSSSVFHVSYHRH